MSSKLILILGGARSGKSSYSEALARAQASRSGGEVLVVATAEAHDDEMRRRIDAHRRRRPAGWRVLEEPRRLGPAIQAVVRDATVVLVDCVTLWLSNLILADERAATIESENVSREVEEALARGIIEEVELLLKAHRTGSATFVVVSNEVGLGLVPPYPFGRVYRDILGRVNQVLAGAADEVYLLVAGLPIELKALAGAWPIATGPDGDGSA